MIVNSGKIISKDAGAVVLKMSLLSQPTENDTLTQHFVGLLFDRFEPELSIVISSTTSRELLTQFWTCSG